MKLVLLILCIGVSIVPSLYAQTGTGISTEKKIRDRIEDMVSQRHPADTREDWLNLGPNAPKIMLGMIKEPGRSIYQRIRMTDALGYFPGEVAVEYLKEQVNTGRPETPSMKKAVIRALAVSQGEKEVETFGKLTEDLDPNIRVLAARILRQIQTETTSGVAKEWIEKFEKKEKISWVVAKSVGEFDATPLGLKLTPSATSEDSLEKALAGHWDITKLEPLSPSKPPRFGVMKMTWEGPEKLRAEIEKSPFEEGGLKSGIWKKRGPEFEVSWVPLVSDKTKVSPGSPPALSGTPAAVPAKSEPAGKKWPALVESRVYLFVENGKVKWMTIYLPGHDVMLVARKQAKH